MTPENEAKKEYLLQYRQMERRINLLLAEKAQLLALATKVTPSYSDAPRGSSSGNRTSIVVEKIIACEDEINQTIDQAVDLREEIKQKINEVPDERLREILRRKYLLGQKWEQVAYEMGLEFRWIRRLHGKALSKLTLESPPKSVI
ncbi:MAG: hypothetical protein ACOX64_14400 [Candidatus Merdivicinus sp.]|jgi:DNA-directed RNA polymerase specialized sigma subunit